MARRTRLIIGVLVVLLGGIALAGVLIARQDHVATAVLQVDPGPAATVSDLGVAEQAATRYAFEVESHVLIDVAIEQLGLDEDPEHLFERVSASADETALTIAVRDEDPEAAYRLALALGEEMIARSGVGFELREPQMADDIERFTQELRLRLREPFRDVMPRVAPPGDEPGAERRHQLEWFAKPKRPPQEAGA